jgi:hypothetical protein
LFKILLVSPPFCDFYATGARNEPLGLLYIRKSLEGMDGVEVHLHDSLLSGRKKRLKTPSEFDYLEEIYCEDRSLFSLLNGFYRFGDSCGGIIGRIKSGGYDLVGVSCMFTGYYPDAEKLISLIKKETGSLVVAGGWAVDAGGTRLFEKSRADFFLVGAGEHSMPLLAGALMGDMKLEDVPGLIYRCGGAVRSVPPAQWAVPDYFPGRMDFYRWNGKRIAKMITGTGCGHACPFCAVGRYRKRSARGLDSIDRELGYLSSAGVEVVDFEDDNIFSDPETAPALLRILKNHHAGGISYAAMNGMTASNIRGRVNDIIDAGFIEINLSLVASGLFRARPFGTDVIDEIVREINGRVKTIVYLIAGLPGSSPADLMSDIIHLAALPVTIGISPLYLLPGIPDLEKIGLPENHALCRGSALYKFGDGFSREDVASAWKFVRMINRVKAGPDGSVEEYSENLHYFRKSIREKTWHRKLKNGNWARGFSFGIDLPENIDIMTCDGRMAGFK